MRYYFAPMEGLTDAICRRAHHQFYPGSVDRYYAPFVSPTKENQLNPRKLRDLLPENNVGVPVIPQVLCKDAAVFRRFAADLAAMGYREVNLNLGCPSGTVVAKGKGAGFLRDPALLDDFFARVFAGPLPLAVSVKTRLGIADPAEFYPLLAVFNRYPIAELTIHPRVQKVNYKGPVALAPFERALAESPLPICYNGSLATATACASFADAHPGLSGIMLGRGLIANPGLLCPLRGLPTAGADTLHAYMDELYQAYAREFGSKKNAVRRMKGFWNYTIALFDHHEQAEKAMHHLREPWEYEALTARIFAQLPLRTDADAAQWERPAQP
ncbi:MAG: tRNA-dihydrouridine synthase [Gemmiger sp.]|nr:tRNA-dihydrouridine synthase [Gemmiger sp.]